MYSKKDLENRRKEKAKKLENAKQSEEHRKPNPQGNHKFEEVNFIEFAVTQDKKPIRLTTFRQLPYKQSDQGQIEKIEPKALLIMYHGLNAHLQTGAHIAHAYAQQGFVVVGFDHRGFGRSEGKRGFIESLDLHLQDSKQFVGMMENIYGKDFPKFVMGLSMGGMTSYRLTLEEPMRYKGAILCNPAILNFNSGATKGLVKFVGSIMPKMNIIKQKFGLGTKNPQITEDYAQDPFYYKEEMTPGTVAVIFKGMEQAEETFNKYESPFIVIHGGADKLVDTDAGHVLCERSPSKDKQLLFYENMWHDSWHEEEINDFLPKIVNWALERI